MYEASLSVNPSVPIAKVPAAWTVAITRNAVNPTSHALNLTCVLWGGEAPAGGDTPPTNADASFLSSTAVARGTVVMASRASTAQCVMQTTYATAGVKVARVQVFVSNGGAVGLLGKDKPVNASATVGLELCTCRLGGPTLKPPSKQPDCSRGTPVPVCRTSRCGAPAATRPRKQRAVMLWKGSLVALSGLWVCGTAY